MATSAQSNKAKQTAKVTEGVTETAVVDTVVPGAIDKATEPIVPLEVDPTQYVVVRNGFQGRLVYKSQRTGERYIWDSFGGEQEIELRELKNAKNTSKKFFINNWFMFDEDWIPVYLGVGQYYKNALDINNFDDIFTMEPEELGRRIDALSIGQKKSVAYRAMELIADGKIDSRKTIAVLEEHLGTALVEK